MPRSQLFLEDVSVGTRLTPIVKRPSTAQLFRFSAVTWNAHRIHYDKPYALTEGYLEVLVQAHLHGCFLLQAVMDWAGPRARVTGFGWQNRAIAVPDDILTCTGTVTSVASGIVECELEERNQRNELCATGKARIRFPGRD
jgi:hydroxyacyl-ACP dehydratase HTD2-like protein with hotdog domain